MHDPRLLSPPRMSAGDFVVEPHSTAENAEREHSAGHVEAVSTRWLLSWIWAAGCRTKHVRPPPPARPTELITRRPSPGDAKAPSRRQGVPGPGGSHRYRQADLCSDRRREVGRGC
eukprot:9061100-Alexandrium_andersonii.AAC.1